MNKCYYRIVWENDPSDKTPLNEQNLNKIDVATDEIDNRIISLNSTKFDKTEAQMLVRYIEYEEDTGIFKITHYNGASYTIDTLLEKLAINFDYDYQTQRLIIELSDSTVKYVDLSALLTQYEFLESETVAFTVDNTGKVTAKVKEGSIQEKHLRPDYLADIKVEVAKAEASAVAADTSEKNAKKSEEAALASQTEAKKSETASAESAEAAAGSAESANQKANEAEASAEAANQSKEAAAESAISAASAQTEAESAKTAAFSSAEAAARSEFAASGSAAAAEFSAKEAESYAVGTGGVRPNEATDSAKYYYEQSKGISEGLAGALQPMGTVTFANLPTLANAGNGWMYNISDQFTTTVDFKEGAGNVIPAGANIYKTADGFWDILAGTPVTSVNGQTGNVEIKPENIGALPDTTKYAASETVGGAANYLRGFFSGHNVNSGIEPSGYENIISYIVGTSDIYGIADGAEFVQAYAPSYIYQMYGDYRSGQLATRGKSNNVWGSWRRQLDDQNYTRLTPKLAPQAHYYSTDARQQGYYKISINADTSWMLSCMVMLYQGYNAYVILVSGYQFMQNHWYSPKAELVAATEGINSISVTFGYDGVGKLWFAVPSGNYTGLTVCNINNGYTQVEDWADKISIKYEESLSGTVQAEKTAYAPTKSPEVRSIRKVASLPSDAASHTDTLYLVIG